MLHSFKVLGLAVLVAMPVSGFAENANQPNSNNSEATAAAPRSANDSFNFKIATRTGLMETGNTYGPSIYNPTGLSYWGINGQFSVPVTESHSVNVFLEVDVNRIAVSSGSETAVAPSMMVGASNYLNCRWCVSAALGAERAAIYNLTAGVGTGSPDQNVFDSVALIKAQADLGYRLFVGEWAVGPQLHYEWLQPRGFQADQSYGMNLSSTNRICPKIKFDRTSGAFKNIGAAADYCYQFQTVEITSNDGSSRGRYSSATQSLGVELSYQF